MTEPDVEAHNFDDLVKKRGRFKAKITRIENSFIKGKNSNDLNTNEVNIWENMLIKAFEDYEYVQDLIEEQEATQEFDRATVESQYTSLRSKLQTYAQSKSSDISGVLSDTSNIYQQGHIYPTAIATPANSSPKVKLPNINIPIFTGKYEDYRSFTELFSALIDSDTHINDVQKFLYLKSVLRDEPLSIIKDLSITAANYTIARDLLKKRYDNKLITINCHIRVLMEVQIAKGAPGALRDFIAKIKQNYNALSALGVPVKEWDLLLVHMISAKLDFVTHRAYELERDSQTLPTFEEFIDFLEKRCSALEALTNPEQGKSKGLGHNKSSFHSASNSKNKCICCEQAYHPMFRCNKFSRLEMSRKRDFIMKNKLCFNCLSATHPVSACSSEGCRVCKGKHHTMIHEDKGRKAHGHKTNSAPQTDTTSNPTTSQVTDSPGSSSAMVTVADVENANQTNCFMSNTSKQVLLATAKVYLLSNDGSKVLARSLLDSGSQTSFITANMANKLGLKAKPESLQVSGIGQTAVPISKFIKVTIQCRTESKFQTSVNCGIMKKITCPLPHSYIDTKAFDIPNGLALADETFHVPGEIDVLLGADVYFEIIRAGIVRFGKAQPLLQNSHLGWIVGGSISTTSHAVSNLSVALFTRNQSLDELLPQFWRLEEVTDKKHLSPEDKLCETIYSKTTRRDEEGIFEVKLPLKSNFDASCLGQSLDKATRRLYSLERRLSKDPKLKHEYTAFINEYLSMGHAKEISADTASSTPNRYYFPHHCVVREDKLTTKYRVVFDGSMKTTSGLSLNDITLKGSPVQPELFDIISRFRTFRYVLTSDIQKMYRCIKVTPEDRKLQNIVWRDDPCKPLRHIELQTVTYGTNCAPYLATRTLVELAKQNEVDFPLAAETLLKQTYVDDLLGGANTPEELVQLKNELNQVLKSAGFMLHKWNSNEKSIVMSPEKENLKNKVLGVSWDPAHDEFQICTPELDPKVTFTKREVLGCIAQIYDPMGFVGPVIILAKVIMQQLWSLKIEWDETLPPEVLSNWLTFYSQLPELQKLSISRCILIPGKIVTMQLIGFSDASLKAYGACLYVRTMYEGNSVCCRLLCSKSRVAPLKTVSLPRLELCGFLLLARMVNRCIENINLKFNQVVMFTDSEIVLAWLQSPPSRWNTFVANRVSEIQELATNADWRHVQSEHNPSDHISRGLDPNTIINQTDWWEGPPFLRNPDWSIEPRTDPQTENLILPEQKAAVHVVESHMHVDISFSLNISSYTRLQRITAYILRFLNNSKKVSIKLNGTLSVEELVNAKNCLFKLFQNKYFFEEISCLKQRLDIPKKSPLLTLNPFLDSHGILRVGGRLDNSSLSYDAKHPIIVPGKCHLSELLYLHEHARLGHSGPRMVLNSLRQHVWPIRGLRYIKQKCLKCIKCIRFKAATAEQLMGTLPVERTQLIRPFLNVGIDFGGPLMVKESRLRKPRISKAYIALFVCMATKAIHLELVSSLSTPAFLQTLKRFIARRGNPYSISSDNATNFKGANNALQDTYTFFKDHGNEIQEFLSTKEIKWKFIPPGSPHWGGLWEAGIKSTKYHLKRILGRSTLTFEDLTTVLAEIEAILNSRPLQELSEDISDLSCLTPGHFLIGQALTAFPEKNVVDVPDNKLNIWQLCIKLRQEFWTKWSTGYLNQLQSRPKWKYGKINLKIGDLVLLKEDNSPPLEWCLARIVSVKQGHDQRVRVIEVKTSKEEWTAVKNPNQPNFIGPIRNVTVAVGREAVLVCSVRHLGKYKVAWVRAEDQTILSLHTRVVTHNNRVSVAHDDGETWKLRIRPVKESDRGCYLCQINTQILKSQKGCLDVYVPPDILNENTSGDTSISEGDNTTLICKASGHPSPRITWRREDGNPILIRKNIREYFKAETYNGSNLHFWRLDRRQMGAYLCIASNDIPPAVSKRISLSVNFAPVIKVPNQLLGAPVATDVQLECYVEAYPNTVNYWIKNRGEMLLNGSKYSIKEERSGYKVFMWLVIRSFSASDSGTYNCVSTNSLGKAEGTLRLYEIKVGPDHHHTNVIVEGFAEPARGHRSSVSTILNNPCLLVVSSTIVEMIWR